jgi:hypothetical protein
MIVYAGWLEAPLRAAVRFRGHEPVARAPSGDFVAPELPPDESVRELRAFDHLQNVAVLQRLYGRVVEARSISHTEPNTLRIDDPDPCPYGYHGWRRPGCAGRLDRCEQRGLQSPGCEVFTPQSSELQCLSGRGVGVPFYACLAEILRDGIHANNELADRWPQYLGPAVVHEEAKKAEADVVTGLCEVVTELVPDHGVGHGWCARRAVPEHFSQWARVHLARALSLLGTFQTRALKVLHEAAILLEGLSDGRAEYPGIPGIRKSAQERLSDVVPRLGEVFRGLFLSLASLDGQEEKSRDQAHYRRNDDLLQHGDPGQGGLNTSIIALRSREPQARFPLGTRQARERIKENRGQRKQGGKL